MFQHSRGMWREVILEILQGNLLRSRDSPWMELIFQVYGYHRSPETPASPKLVLLLGTTGMDACVEPWDGRWGISAGYSWTFGKNL